MARVPTISALDLCKPEHGSHGVLHHAEHGNYVRLTEVGYYGLDNLTVEVPASGWSDYGGSTANRSNWKRLKEDYPKVFTSHGNGYSSGWLTIPAHYRITEELFSILVGLAEEYPTYDDDDLATLEEEVKSDDWERFYQDEMREGVRAILDNPPGDNYLDLDEWDSVMDEIAQRCAFNHLNLEWYCESATSSVLSHFEDRLIPFVAEVVRNCRNNTLPLNPDQLVIQFGDGFTVHPCPTCGYGSYGQH